MKKALLLLSITLTFVLTFGMNPQPASAEYYKYVCYEGSECNAVNLYSFGTPISGYSSPIWASSGTTMHYGFTTSSDSVFHVGIRIVDANGTGVTSWRYAPQYGGDNFGFVGAPKTGYYRLQFSCGDTTSGRCKGNGSIWR
ncbi:hypothetical protein AWM68_15955 [Fictibacillus phosphorivorans]|uniref:Uncharacterized protein n=1 Tax=Fictibacillus phosphorivorans TaxID=1221500 RepID=A0A163PBC7_9BACL|nr:hypothetical protein [Fictibacillus phosphorivorans]KZE63286.1 hypothetical protein AWM68_15955 [Fictibacillus phosphorivorans]